MKPVPVLLITTSALIFSGCSDTNISKQTQGTIIGGGTGALIGSQIGGGAGALVGTGIGAVGGALVGSDVGKSIDTKDRRQVTNP